MATLNTRPELAELHFLRPPFEADEDAANSISIIDQGGNTLCSIIDDQSDDEISEAVYQQANLIVAALNEYVDRNPIP